MENELIELGATIVAGAGTVIAALRREAVAACIAGAVTLIALAATLEAL